MSKYNLDHFPADQFEAFCQSLLCSLFGVSLRFSHHKGADGGADATYEGKCGVAGFEDWDGTWVFQVKHHDVGYLGTRGGNNAVKQDIRKELSKISKRSQRIDNYVLVTNVILYPETDQYARHAIPGTGSISRVEIIDYSKIEAILDIDPTLRTAWQEQLGDVISRLSQKISNLSQISTDFLSQMVKEPGRRSDERLSREQSQSMSDLRNATVEGRKKLFIQLRQFASEQFVFPLLGSMAIDSMLLETFPEIDFACCHESLKEGFQTLAAIPSPVVTAFLLGNVCYPHLADDFEDTHYRILEDLSFQSLKTIDPERVAEECVKLCGLVRARYGIWHIGRRNDNRRQDIAEWTLTLRNLISKVRIKELRIPEMAGVIEKIKYTFDLEGEYVFVAPTEVKSIRESFDKIMRLPKMKSLGIDEVKKAEVAVICLMEDVYGITGEEWDLREDSPVQKKRRIVMKILERQLCSTLVVAGQLSEEEFSRRAEFTELMDCYWHRKIEAGDHWFNDPPYEFLTSSVLKDDTVGGNLDT